MILVLYLIISSDYLTIGITINFRHPETFEKCSIPFKFKLKIPSLPREKAIRHSDA